MYTLHAIQRIARRRLHVSREKTPSTLSRNNDVWLVTGFEFCCYNFLPTTLTAHVCAIFAHRRAVPSLMMWQRTSCRVSRQREAWKWTAQEFTQPAIQSSWSADASQVPMPDRHSPQSVLAAAALKLTSALLTHAARQSFTLRREKCSFIPAVRPYQDQSHAQQNLRTRPHQLRHRKTHRCSRTIPA